jgi:hypothetical protein
MLARRFLPLRRSAIRLYAAASQFRSTPQCLVRAQASAVRRGFPPSRLRQPVAGPESLHGMAWCLALVGFFFAVLALSLPGAVSPVAGEAMDPLRATAPGSEASLVLSRAEEPPLPAEACLTSLPDARLTRGDGDVDDDAPAIPLLVLRAESLPPPPVGIDRNGSPHTGGWPTDYLVRPQLLTRL